MSAIRKGWGDFPLSISADKRRFVTPYGVPFLMIGDTPWMMPNQLTNAQIDTYLNSLATLGLTAILIEAPGFLFTDHSAGATSNGVNMANNADGVAPFTVMNPFNWVLNEAYWVRVDYIVNRCKRLGIFVWINPAYLGFLGTTGSGSGIEGCMGEITAASAGTLQTYGTTIANRYTQGNVGWSEGGDYAGNTTERDKLHNVFTGIRSVRASDIVIPHPARGEVGYSLWGPGGRNYAHYNADTTYTASDGTDAYSLMATEYARTNPVYPVVQIEHGYFGEATDLQARRACWESMLSGAAAILFGTKLWSFGDAIAGGAVGAASALATWIGSAGYLQLSYMVALMKAYAWWKLVPKTDTSLVTTSLGLGTTRVCPAKASDNSFAMIYAPATTIATVDMTNFAQSSVRGRWFDPTANTFADSLGTPFANTGTQIFTAPGERVLVLD